MNVPSISLSIRSFLSALRSAAAFFFLSIGYIILMAIGGAVGLVAGGIRLPRLQRISWPQRLVVLYVAVTWISAVCSPFWPVTLLGASRYEGALTITLYGVGFLLASAYGTGGRKLLALLGAAVTAFSLICLAQLFGGNPLGLYPGGYNYWDAGTAYLGAYLGTIGNADIVAAFYCLAIPMLAYALVRLKGKGRFLLAAPLALALWVLVWMDVSAGLVGVLGSCMAAIPVAGFIDKQKRKKSAWALAGLLLCGLLALYVIDAGTGMFHEAHCLLHGEWDATFGSGRLHIWSQVLQRVPEHLWLGAGPDTMLYGGLESFTRYSPSGESLVARIDIAHNDYLNILYHQGVLGLAAYGALLAALFKRWAAQSPTNPQAAILGAGCLGWCIQGFFGIGTGGMALFFWLALALLSAPSAPLPCQRTGDVV